MMVFKQRTLWGRLLRLIPSRRRRQDAALEAAITRLMNDPGLPCVVEGTLIPNGYGIHDPVLHPKLEDV